MGPSWWQILIVLVLLVLLFGRGKISQLMADVAKGIKSLKVGLAEEPSSPEKTRDIEHELASTNAVTGSRAKEPRG